MSVTEGEEEGELEERCSSQHAEAQREMHNPVDGQDSVYVGEIRDGTGHARIKHLFLRYGPRRVYVRKSSYHTNSEFAHITFGSARAAAAAYAELQNEEMDKRRLFLSLSTKKNELLTDANHMGRFDVMLKGLPARYIRAEIIAKLERKLPKQVGLRSVLLVMSVATWTISFFVDLSVTCPSFTVKMLKSFWSVGPSNGAICGQVSLLASMFLMAVMVF
ncbi:hypothetical protein RvY_09827 [Ramazzottius varieornatus]|uniref:RRM domain-containing protein n=1 Tax=Ramazzottius varieornatus TaxID=947166 RepID=A0A1D1VAQ1_RAMVA|nr:hypothetical protein RvY_09827 [Ramazzottius varieornatus]